MTERRRAIPGPLLGTLMLSMVVILLRVSPAEATIRATNIYSTTVSNGCYLMNNCTFDVTINAWSASDSRGQPHFVAESGGTDSDTGNDNWASINFPNQTSSQWQLIVEIAIGTNGVSGLAGGANASQFRVEYIANSGG